MFTNFNLKTKWSLRITQRQKNLYIPLYCYINSILKYKLVNKQVNKTEIPIARVFLKSGNADQCIDLSVKKGVCLPISSNFTICQRSRTNKCTSSTFFKFDGNTNFNFNFCLCCIDCFYWRILFHHLHLQDIISNGARRCEIYENVSGFFDKCVCI